MFGLVARHRRRWVDDAIVLVVENVEAADERGGSPRREATRKSMTQSLVRWWDRPGVVRRIRADGLRRLDRRHLSPGFSLTIVSAMVLSVLVALILTPASLYPARR